MTITKYTVDWKKKKKQKLSSLIQHENESSPLTFMENVRCRQCWYCTYKLARCHYSVRTVRAQSQLWIPKGNSFLSHFPGNLLENVPRKQKRCVKITSFELNVCVWEREGDDDQSFETSLSTVQCSSSLILNSLVLTSDLRTQSFKFLLTKVRYFTLFATG